MKNHPLAVIMVILLMFNMVGYPIYSLWYSVGSVQADGFASGDFVIIKVPASLPYLTDLKSTEDANTEFFHDDNFYHIVDQHIASDTLYLHCKFSQNARERFWNLVNSLELDSKNQSQIPNLLFKNILKEYVSISKRHYFFIFEWSTSVAYQYLEAFIPEPFKTITGPPPIGNIA